VLHCNRAEAAVCDVQGRLGGKAAIKHCAAAGVAPYFFAFSSLCLRGWGGGIRQPDELYGGPFMNQLGKQLGMTKLIFGYARQLSMVPGSALHVVLLRLNTWVRCELHGLTMPVCQKQ
jgi:hypothetical protein